MLAKVSVYINESGNVTYFENPKRKINLRGTKFSIAKPLCGREGIAKNLILREDPKTPKPSSLLIKIKRKYGEHCPKDFCYRRHELPA